MLVPVQCWNKLRVGLFRNKLLHTSVEDNRDVMAESNPEVKSDKYTTLRNRDHTGCDGEQRSLMPKRQASEEYVQRKKVNII